MREPFLKTNPPRIIVIVDDDVDVRESLTSFLRAAGFLAAPYSSAEDALKSEVFREAACVISDLRMPGIHGLELEKLLKEQFPNLPFLLMTGHNEEITGPDASGERGARLFPKPIDTDKLLRTVRALLT